MHTCSTAPADCAESAATDLASHVAAPTLESLEAGLLALAHGLGREHAALVRRAMNGVLQATPAPASLPPQAAALGAALDSSSLEQADLS